MYSKKYRIEKIEEFNNEEFNNHNPVYVGVEGRVAYPVYFKVGERGWFLWVEDYLVKEFVHRIHTSVVQNVVYTDDKIFVTTQNTKFTFVKIN